MAFAKYCDSTRLVSLMELLRFEADAYCRLTAMIGQLLCHFQIAGSGQATIAGLTIKSEVYGTFGATLGEMQLQIEKLNLPSAQKHFSRMKWAFDNEQITRGMVGA